MTGSWQIGDALTLSRGLADNSIDCIVTSPPYWGLRSYLADDDAAKGLEMGAEPTLSEYVERMVVLFRELRRALKPGGTCWLNLGDCYSAGAMSGSKGPNSSTGHNKGQHDGARFSRKASASGLKPKDLCLVPYRVAMALQADGWFLRSHIIWAKPNPMPESVTDRPTSAHEAVFLLTKEPRYWYDADAIAEPAIHAGKVVSLGEKSLSKGQAAGANVSRSGNALADSVTVTSKRNKRNVWTIATKPYSGSHYAVMPPKLVEPCIKAGCPAKVCAECGAPWVRVVDVETAPNVSRTRNVGGRDDGYTTPTHGGGIPPSKRITKGWEPTCDHDAATRPGLVLDPFGGSGTVGEVAESLGRRWLMFDLDARNEALMHKRTAQRSLLGCIA